MKRQHIWIKAVFERITASRKGDRSKTGNDMVNTINNENDKLMADYRVHFNSLVSISKDITRLSPAAAFTYLSTDIAGTGISEEQEVKAAVLQYKDMVFNLPTDNNMNVVGELPAFSYKRRSIRDILGGDGIVNLTVLFLFTMLSFTAAYVMFLRYDVR